MHGKNVFLEEKTLLLVLSIESPLGLESVLMHNLTSSIEKMSISVAFVSFVMELGSLRYLFCEILEVKDLMWSGH